MEKPGLPVRAAVAQVGDEPQHGGLAQSRREALRGENPRHRPAQILPQCPRELLRSGKPTVIHVDHLNLEELVHPGESPGGTLVRMYSCRSIGCTSRRRRFSVIRAEFSATKRLSSISTFRY